MDAEAPEPQRRIARAPGVIAVPVGGELLLHDPATDRYVRLNASAAVVWQRMEAPRTVGEIAAALAEQYGVREADARADARRVVDDLVERAMARVT